MHPTRTAAARSGGVPWWAFSPLALVLVIVTVLGVTLLGGVGGPASTAALGTETAAGCTITPPTGSPGTTQSDRGGVGTVGGTVVLDATQLLNAQTIVAVGKGLAAPVRAVAVALAVAYQDSKLSATASVGNGVAAGLFLQTITAYPGVNRGDPAAAAAAFLTRLLTLPAYLAGQPLGVVAEAMQNPTHATGFPTSDEYQAHAGWATDLATTLATGTTPNPPAVQTSSGATGSAVVCVDGAGDNTVFDPGNIISDAVFYNPTAMTAAQIRAFLTGPGAGCPDRNPWCVKNLRLTTPAIPADGYCTGYPGGTDQDTGTILAGLATACGINPQVMLTTLQRESQGLTRTDPTATSWDAAFGWGCPDTGPGGAANCAAAGRGFFAQAFGMAHQWARYRVEIPHHRYRFAVGTYHILGSFAETGCGGTDVTIRNVGTAALYVYTPYQPNPASVAGYPGVGDRCSSYGNRNFWFLFRSYFGPTGGGAPGPTGIGGPITVSGTVITLPAKAGVGGTVTAPNPVVATVISAGLGWLGQPYTWGGGNPAGPTHGICTPGGITDTACHTVGFDCSGLMLYMWAQIGIQLPRYSQDQLTVGAQVPYSRAVAGDLIGYPGHVAMFLGTINQVQYMLEAPYTGSSVRVTPVRNGHYPKVSRVWAARS